MAKATKPLLLATSLLALGACSDQQKIFYSWNEEAGRFLDYGTFGNATMNNT